MSDEHEVCNKEYQWGKLNGSLQSIDKSLVWLWRFNLIFVASALGVAVKVIFFQQ